jgi:hypothetical protein
MLKRYATNAQPNGLYVTTPQTVKESIQHSNSDSNTSGSVIEQNLACYCDQDQFNWIFDNPQDKQRSFHHDFHRNYVYFSNENQTVYTKYRHYLAQHQLADTDDHRTEFIKSQFDEKFPNSDHFKHYLHHYRQGIYNAFVTGFLSTIAHSVTHIEAVYGGPKKLTIGDVAADGRLNITATTFCYKIHDGNRIILIPGYLRQNMKLDERGFEIETIEASNELLFKLLTQANDRQEPALNNNHTIIQALQHELNNIDTNVFPDDLSTFVQGRLNDKNLTAEEQQLITELVTQLSFESLCGVDNPRTDWGDYLKNKHKIELTELYQIAGFHVIKAWYRNNSYDLQQYDRDLLKSIMLIIGKLNNAIVDNKVNNNNALHFYLFARHLVDSIDAIKKANNKASYLQQLIDQYDFNLSRAAKNQIQQFINQCAGKPFQTSLVADAYHHLKDVALSQLLDSVDVGNALKQIDDWLNQWFNRESFGVANRDDIKQFKDALNKVSSKINWLGLKQIDVNKLNDFVKKAEQIANIIETFNAIGQPGAGQHEDNNLNQAFRICNTIFVMLKADVTAPSHKRHRFVERSYQLGQQFMGRGQVLTLRAYGWLAAVAVNVSCMLNNAESDDDPYSRLIKLLQQYSQDDNVIKSIKNNQYCPQLRKNIWLFILNQVLAIRFDSPKDETVKKQAYKVIDSIKAVIDQNLVNESTDIIGAACGELQTILKGQEHHQRGNSSTLKQYKYHQNAIYRDQVQKLL